MTLRGFRVRILALVILAVLPALLVIGLAGINQRDTTIERERAHLVELARAVGLQQQRMVERVEQLLATVEVVLDRPRGTDPMTCMSVLADLSHAYRTYGSLGVTDARGRIACANDPVLVGRDLAASRIFTSVQAGDRFAVGDVSGFDSMRSVLPFGRALTDRDGTFAGLAFATLPLHQLAGAAVDLGLPADARVDLFDVDGRLLMRYPDPEGFAGADLSGEPLLAAAHRTDPEQDAMAGQELQDLDGITRSYAFSRVGGEATELLVAVGRPTALTVAAAQRVTEVAFLGVLALAIATLVVAWSVGARLVVAPLEEAVVEATHDPLTGLHNRRGLAARVARLEHERSAVRRPDPAPGTVAAIMFDLDRFGELNKQHGHAFGDLALREFGAVLRERFRERDVVARLGGEEFAAIVEVREPGDAVRIAEDVRRRFAERGRTIGEGRGVAPTVSAGVAAWDAAGDLSVDELLHEADLRLRSAKATGRDRVVGPAGVADADTAERRRFRPLTA